MAIIRKDRHVLSVIKHAQPCGYPPLLEVQAPDGFKWAGDTWSLHGDDMADLRQRIKLTDLEAAEAGTDL